MSWIGRLLIAAVVTATLLTSPLVSSTAQAQDQEEYDEISDLITALDDPAQVGRRSKDWEKLEDSIAGFVEAYSEDAEAMEWLDAQFVRLANQLPKLSPIIAAKVVRRIGIWVSGPGNELEGAALAPLLAEDGLFERTINDPAQSEELRGALLFFVRVDIKRSGPYSALKRKLMQRLLTSGRLLADVAPETPLTLLYNVVAILDGYRPEHLEYEAAIGTGKIEATARSTATVLKKATTPSEELIETGVHLWHMLNYSAFRDGSAHAAAARSALLSLLKDGSLSAIIQHISIGVAAGYESETVVTLEAIVEARLGQDDYAEAKAALDKVAKAYERVKAMKESPPDQRFVEDLGNALRRMIYFSRLKADEIDRTLREADVAGPAPDYKLARVRLRDECLPLLQATAKVVRSLAKLALHPRYRRYVNDFKSAADLSLEELRDLMRTFAATLPELGSERLAIESLAERYDVPSHVLRRDPDLREQAEAEATELWMTTQMGNDPFITLTYAMWYADSREYVRRRQLDFTRELTLPLAEGAGSAEVNDLLRATHQLYTHTVTTHIAERVIEGRPLNVRLGAGK